MNKNNKLWKRTSLLFPGLALVLLSVVAHADDNERKCAHFISNWGTALYLISGPLVSLSDGGTTGKNHAVRDVDALIIDFLATEAVKQFVNEPRPNGTGSDSFPSLHTSMAFTLAGMQSAWHPSQAPYWYGGAALIGWARTREGYHHWYDVVAGAALGYGVARWEISRKNGMLLTPWIEPEEHSAGVTVSIR